MQGELLSRVSFAAQYAHETEGGRETIKQAFERVKQMHLSKFEAEIHPFIEEAFRAVEGGQVYPSQRSTQFGGAEMLREGRGWRIYNCTASYCDRPRFFSEYFWLLLMGCGCGVSVQTRHVNQLPPLISANQGRARGEACFEIPDTIEGWAEAAYHLITSYIPTEWMEPLYTITFDYSAIRPEGAPISSGGVSAGSSSLMRALEEVRTILEGAVLAGSERLTPLNCFDLCAALSSCVLAGGVRRSASIMLFDSDDEEMMTSKRGDWWRDHPHRSTANISIRSDGAADEISTALNHAREWGEPGVFCTHPQIITNPCAEIGLYPQLPISSTTENHLIDSSHMSGWQACNLTEINVGRCSGEAEFLEACRSAAIIGVLQSCYTDQGYLLSISRQIVERERLLGVSLTGIYENPSIGLNEALLRRGAEVVKSTAWALCDVLDIPRSSRLTCIKPSGNTSVLGNTSAGAHPYHSDRYIRRMRVSTLNPVWKYLSEHLPEVCTQISDDTGLFSFAISAPVGAMVRADLTAIQHLENISLLQRAWVAPGSDHIHNRVPQAAHSVSCTVTVREGEWAEVIEWMIHHQSSATGAGRLRGVSFLGDMGDLKYQNAPYQNATGEALEEWERLSHVDWTQINLSTLTGGRENPNRGAACSGGGCLIEYA